MTLAIFFKPRNRARVSRLVKPHPSVAALADRAFRAGVAMLEVCARAGVPGSTWWRWTRGSGHTEAKLAQLERALAQIIEEDNG